MSFLAKVSIERDGKTYVGEYSIKSGMLTLTTPKGGRKATHVGGMPAAALARLLMGELVNEGNA
jgi:hypothetical protein